VASGTSGELKARLGGETVELRSDTGEVIRQVPTDGTVSGLRRALDEIDESGAIGTVTLHRPTLDDVFLSLTGRSLRDTSGEPR
jgi:ABC-2 type transport system ATP-binding protein